MPYIKVIALFVAIGAATQAGSLGMYYGIMYMIRNEHTRVNGKPKTLKQKLRSIQKDAADQLSRARHRVSEHGQKLHSKFRRS